MRSVFPDFSRRLLELLRDRQINWTRLAKETSLSRPTLYRLARGDGNPLLSNLVSLANHLGLTVAALLGPQGEAATGRGNASKGAKARALLGEAPRGDDRAREIYEAICRVAPEAELREQLQALRYLQTGESFEAGLVRAILDTVEYRMEWIDGSRLERLEALEARIQEEFGLPDRQELEDARPVRVLKLDRELHSLVQIHALAAATAVLLKELLRVYHILGLADGYTVSTIHKYLLRGDLSRAELVPCTYTPRFVDYEFSGPSLAGGLARNHFDYRVRSTTELAQLKQRLEKIEVVVTACGSIVESEPEGRLARLMRETYPSSKYSYKQLTADLRQQGVVGDLLYHFLTKSGEVHPIGQASRALEELELGPEGTYPSLPPGEPLPIFAVSPDGLARIARRGVSILIVHNRNRAFVARAALKRTEKPINFLVLSEDAARGLLDA